MPALLAAILLGLGTALVYPTLIAAVADVVQPVERAQAVGVYRFWRDSGFVAGALISGFVADSLGAGWAIGIVAGITAASSVWVAATRWIPDQRIGDPINLGRRDSDGETDNRSAARGGPTADRATA